MSYLIEISLLNYWTRKWSPDGLNDGRNRRNMVLPSVWTGQRPCHTSTPVLLHLGSCLLSSCQQATACPTLSQAQTQTHTQIHTLDFHCAALPTLAQECCLVPTLKSLLICDWLGISGRLLSSLDGLQMNSSFLFWSLFKLSWIGAVKYESANLMSFYHLQRIRILFKAKLLPVASFFCEALVQSLHVTCTIPHMRPRQKPQCVQSWGFLFF